MAARFSPVPDGCPWGQCEHTANAHTRDHCMGCHCEKPPPPPPGAPDQVELEALELDVCTACGAYVDNREKHVTWHERQLDTMTNLTISVSTLQHRLERLQEQIGALDRVAAGKPDKDF
jgi:hypothetical protein